MHVPVMLDETVGALVRGEARLFFDGTLGDGGHAEAILEAAGPQARLIGTDRDKAAVERVTKRLHRFGDRICVRHANYAQMREVLDKEGIQEVDGVVLDIGFSSDQMDDAARGFSFAEDGPLDMRMDRRDHMTAELIVNQYEEEELANVIYEFGEERASRRIARAIVNRRKIEPFSRTSDLAQVVARAAGGRRGRIHPATRTFQALRIEVNRELECLRDGLRAGVESLSLSGRMAVITFHSLEDRMVKRYFRELAGAQPHAYRLLTKKPMRPSESEVAQNPRARSAKMRVIERTNEKAGQEIE